MSYAVMKITSKGQVTIPKSVRDDMNLKAGDEVAIVRMAGDSGYSLMPCNKSIDDVAGSLYDPNRPVLTIEDMNEAVAKTAGERYERSFDRD